MNDSAWETAFTFLAGLIALFLLSRRFVRTEAPDLSGVHAGTAYEVRSWSVRSGRRLSVRFARVPPLRFTLRRWSVWTRVGRLLGLVRPARSGDAAFDERFLLTTPEPEARTVEYFHRPRRQAALAAFTLGFTRLTADRDGLSASVRQILGDEPLTRATLAPLLDALDALSRAD
jgi:hypothetical protein